MTSTPTLDRVIRLVKDHRKGISIASCIIVAAIVVWPFLLICSASGWSRLSAYFSYLYTVSYIVLTFLTLLVLLGAALFAKEQLEEYRRTKELNLVMDLNRYYSSQKMGQAIHAVWNTPIEEMARAESVVKKTDPSRIPDEIKSKWRMHNQRRMVSDYMNMVAWAIKEDLIKMKFIYSRFGGGAFNIWVKQILPVEFKLRVPIEVDSLNEEIQKGERPPMSPHELIAAAIQRAKHHTENELPTTQVARAYMEFVEREEKRES